MNDVSNEVGKHLPILHETVLWTVLLPKGAELVEARLVRERIGLMDQIQRLKIQLAIQDTRVVELLRNNRQLENAIAAMKSLS